MSGAESGNQDHKKILLRIFLSGLVQGVGFRPFVFRLASELGLTGWVCNSVQGVTVEIEGDIERLNLFAERLEAEAPPHSMIQHYEKSFHEAVGYSSFIVRDSQGTGSKDALILPDMATCPDCLNDIRDPDNRRYRYPFTNCTNCGPRYSIIQSLPYDRSGTTMRVFPMCDRCRAEYEDPGNRRFHAQPNACPDCGPHLQLWDRGGDIMAVKNGAIREACDIIRKGEILALKGLGGFQLLVDASNDDAVRRLRRRKGREEKPLALMYPDLSAIRRDCQISALEERLVTSSEAPIVLISRKPDGGGDNSSISPSVAPQNPYLGVMVPYTPLHHLLLHDLGFPVVATSGNITDEPICIDENEALVRLKDIADKFLVHNRPIARQMDDSVIQVICGHPQVLRNARGYAPTNIELKNQVRPTIAVGAHLKNTVAIADRKRAVLSQHIGDLDTLQAYQAMSWTVHSLSDLYEFNPEISICDLHPDYVSTRFATEKNLPAHQVQHHYAHVLACMADNDIDPPVLGVAWDGTGLGTDKTIWGGEFLLVDNDSFRRSAYLKTFRLPGGETAIREPRRTAMGLLYELFGDGLLEMNHLKSFLEFEESERRLLAEMMKKNINCPLTSSAGRLFDAASSILGLCHINAYEGQGGMVLGFAAEGARIDRQYPFEMVEVEGSYVVDWAPMMRNIVDDMDRHEPPEKIAAMFHNTLAGIIVAVAKRIGERKVALTGGCFQNRYLCERVIHLLNDSGFKPFWHHRIPPNDGGIAMGQILAASRIRNGEK